MANLVWFRHDLRVTDNPALFHASAAQDGVIALYVLNTELIDQHHTSPVQLDFIVRHLCLLSQDLAAINIPLLLERVESTGDIPGRLLRLCQTFRCNNLYLNAEYPVDEQRRDRMVADLLGQHSIGVQSFHGHVVVPPGSIRNKQGMPYQVFTPFKKRWLQQALPMFSAPLPSPKPQPPTDTRGSSEAAIEQVAAVFPLRDLRGLWPAGEDEALRRLSAFVTEDLDDYHWQRDLPAVEGTSMLSPYLAVGSISARQCVNAALSANQGEWDSGSKGAVAWMTELIWREFYQHLVVDFPRVSMNRPMQARTEAFPWKRDPALFQRWCSGETGVPIVDAAMRQLKETGWMHNRLRMIVAMYLTKNLQIDWRMGERYFMSQLIDGDFAANNGGWQWSASTGADAAPYFRIFNPVSQSKRFDPEGEFIKSYIPELSHLSRKAIHDPPPTQGYPAPLVDLGESRKSTLTLFSDLPRARD
jgi:deoxyribodipyrimidine photo-lyase